VSGGLFNLFQMTQQEEDVLSLEDSGSEYFDTAEAGSSADEMEECLWQPEQTKSPMASASSRVTLTHSP
jgi:hypothetical protein